MPDADTTLAQLKQLVNDFVDRRDWHQFHSPKNVAASIVIEAAELLEQPSVEVLVVKRMSAAGPQRVFGVLTPDTVSRACRDRAST